MRLKMNKVHIKKPENITDKELRELLKKLRLKAKITDAQMQIHVTTWNENGIFCLGMEVQKALTAHYLENHLKPKKL